MYMGLMNDPARPVVEQIESFGKAAYDFVDLTMEAPQARSFDTDPIRDALRRYGMFTVGHTDPCLPYAYPLTTLRAACLEELEACARVFSTLGARVMNIHPCYSLPPKMRASIIDLHIEALQPIVAMAREHHLTLALENFTAPFDRVETFALLLHKVPGLMVHLDVGHTNFGADDTQAFCAAFGGRIVHVHLSDNRGSADHHMPLGVGSVRWKESLGALRRSGYDGTITLEVFCDDPTVQFRYLDISRDFVRGLWAGEDP